MTDRLTIKDIPLREISKALGGVVLGKEDIDHGAEIMTPQYTLWFSLDTYRKKLNVSFTFPRYQDARGEFRSITTQDILTYEERTTHSIKTSITCAYDKGAQAIAKNVARRLVPQAIELTERAKKLVEQRNAYEGARDATGTRLIQCFGYEADKRNPELLYASGLPRLQVSPKSVRFDNFYCSEVAALKILAILKDDKPVT